VADRVTPRWQDPTLSTADRVDLLLEHGLRPVVIFCGGMGGEGAYGPETSNVIQWPTTSPEGNVTCAAHPA